MDVTFDALVQAYFSASRWRRAADELRDYHAKRRALLAELFECDLDVIERDADARGDSDRESVVRVARACLEARVPGIFPVYYEGRPGPLEDALRRAHHDRLARANDEVEAAHGAIFRAALASLCPGAVTRVVDEERLFERGLPREEPDPDDFW